MGFTSNQSFPISRAQTTDPHDTSGTDRNGLVRLDDGYALDPTKPLTSGNNLKPDDYTTKLSGTNRDGFIRVDDGYALDPAKLLTSCNNFWDQAEAIARNIKFNRLSTEQRRHTAILIT